MILSEDKNKALQWLRDRGYDEQLLNRTISKVEERSGFQHILAIEDKHRAKLSYLQSGARRVSPNTIIPLTLTYNAQFKKAPAMLFRHRHTLAATLKQPHRTLVAFRRNKNLTDLLVHPSYRAHIQKYEEDHVESLGFSHCRRKLRYRLTKCICGLVHPEGCRLCAHSVDGLSRLPKTKYKILVNQKANCHTRNVVYAIWCRVCAKIYVGETTQPLSMRLDQHLRLMRSPTSTEALYQHFRSHHPSNAFITPLEVIRQLEPKLLQVKESNWINKLGSLIPNGLNTQLDLNQRYKGEFMGVDNKSKVISTPTPKRAFLGSVDKDQGSTKVGKTKNRMTPRSTEPINVIEVTQVSESKSVDEEGTKGVQPSQSTPNIRRKQIQTPSPTKGVCSKGWHNNKQEDSPRHKYKRVSNRRGDEHEEAEPYIQISPFIFVSPRRRGIQRNLSSQRFFKS